VVKASLIANIFLYSL